MHAAGPTLSRRIPTLARRHMHLTPMRAVEPSLRTPYSSLPWSPKPPSCRPVAQPQTPQCARPPQGCKVMLAIEKAKLEAGKPDKDSPYWN